jgi:hypothetical protein
MGKTIVVVSLLTILLGEQCSTLSGCGHCVAVKDYFLIGRVVKVCSDSGRLNAIVCQSFKDYNFYARRKLYMLMSRFTTS